MAKTQVGENVFHGHGGDVWSRMFGDAVEVVRAEVLDIALIRLLGGGVAGCVLEQQ